jgi:hypothetical protein
MATHHCSGSNAVFQQITCLAPRFHYERQSRVIKASYITINSYSNPAGSTITVYHFSSRRHHFLPPDEQFCSKSVIQNYCTAVHSIIRTVPIGQAREWPLLRMNSVRHILDGAYRAYYVTDWNKLIALQFVDELRFGNRHKQTGYIRRYRWDYNL